MPVKTAHLLALLGLLLALASREAQGKPPPVKSPSAQRGEAALRAGDLATAEQALSAAYRQAPSAELLFDLGQLAAAQGQLLAAQDLLRRYLNDPAATPDPAKAAAAQQVLGRPRPPSGKIRVQGDRGGLVSLDGRLLGRLPLVQPLLAAPGSRTVAIEYPGKLLDIPIEVLAGRMVDLQCTRATGAIFLNMLPALLLVPELPDSAPATLDQLLDAIERAAQGEQRTILKPEALLTLLPEFKDLPEAKAASELKQCLGQPECLQQLLQKAQLEHALRVRARASKDPPATEPAWELAAELVHASVLGIASQKEQPCSPCTEAKAAAALQELVSRTLADGLLRPRGTLAVRSEPTGATVHWGERPLGRTPLALPAWVGDYTLELRQPGHVPVVRSLRVQSGQTAEVTATLPVVATPLPPLAPIAPLSPVPSSAPRHWERGPRPRWRLVAGATCLLLGVSLTVGGTLALGLTLNQTCPAPPASQPPGCEPTTLSMGLETGAGLTAAGGALVLTGVGLLAWPGPRQLVPTSAATNER